MASIQKHKRGWRAQVAVKGNRRSKVFPTRQEARDWAAGEEIRLRGGAKAAAAVTFGEVMERYAREVSPTKRGHRWEEIRLLRYARDPIGRHRMADLTPQHFADWRDARLAAVAPGTVLREMTLLRSVLMQAQREWGLIDRNPMEGVRRPAAPAARERLPTDDEIEALRIAAGEDLGNATARAFHAFQFACETAMRAGEICGLTWDRVDLDERVARLDRTKNGTARNVPLSSAAVQMLHDLPPARTVFDLSSRQLDSLWRKLRDRAGVEGLTFHDSRAAALTRLSRKLDVLSLARVSGHRDVNLLLRVYYRESAADLAKRLD